VLNLHGRRLRIDIYEMASTWTIGRALLQACKHGSLTEANTLTPHLLATGITKETAPPLTVAMATAAYHGHSDILRNLMNHHRSAGMDPKYTPWNPPIPRGEDAKDIPQEFRDSIMPDLVVMEAGAGGEPRVMQTLMDFGMPVDLIMDKVGTPLSVAIPNGKHELVRFLLAKGANPNDQFWISFEPFLMRAASLPKPDIMVALLDNGARMKGGRALEGAAEKGRIEAAEILLKRGADVDEIFRMGLFDDKPQFDVRGTALHVAVKNDQEEFVRFLLERGVRRDLRDGDGRTALEVAVVEGKEEMMRLLQD
jgi:hypothetical protein